MPVQKEPFTAMADIFREIDEEVRRDKALEFWKRNGNKLVGLAILAVLATAGWRAYDFYQTKEAQASGARFETALEASRAGRTDEAEKEFAALSKDGSSGYRALARFREAAELGKTDAAAAVKLYDGLAADNSYPVPFRDVARVRAALLLVDTATLAELKTRLDPLLVTPGPMSPNARELLGLAALKSGDYETAGRYFDEIIIDRSAPAQVRQRTDLLLGIVRAGPIKPAS